MNASRQRRIGVFIALALATAIIPAGCRWFEPRTPEQQRAHRMAAELVQALGGRDAFEAIRFLRFDFVVYEAQRPLVRRVHIWDRHTGRYRLETRLDDERPLVVVFDLDRRQGRAFAGYDMEPDPDSPERVEQAYDWHVNDTNWLLSVTKLREPGANLTYIGETPFEGRMMPTLALSFEPAPGPAAQKDPCWFYIDSRTHRPVAWSFTPNGRRVEPITFSWHQWQPVGNPPFELPTRFRMKGGTRRIAIENLYAPDQVAGRMFVAP